MEFTLQSLPEGQQYQVDGSHGFFGSKPDSWIDPAVTITLQKQYRIPLYDPEKHPFFDLLVLYRDWYNICGFRFSADMKKRIFASTQPVDQQEVLGKRMRRKKLSFRQLWHIVSALGMRVCNAYVAKCVWEALQLEGDVGPEEWYTFFTRFIGNGRQVRGGVTQWDAHSHITRIICECYKGIARVHGETHHWVLIKNELFKHMAVYGKAFTYIEVYAFVMPSLFAHQQSTWAEGYLLHSSSAGVHEVSGC